MVSGCVDFLQDFALTFGPFLIATARYVRKVSSFFQVVNWPTAGEAWLSERLPGLPDRPRGRRQ
jgi:hypothetical protein